MILLLRRFIEVNQRLFRRRDRFLLSEQMRLDGNRDFKVTIVPSLLRPGLRVYNMGGGSNPYLDPATNAELNLFVVGLDISEDELFAAPTGAYDKTIGADLCKFCGLGDADLVICQATLEQVSDTSEAIRAIAETLRPGGVAAIFVPSRHAVFARLNSILPESVKRRLLFSLVPQKALGHDGFKAYYDRCTPAQIARMASANGLNMVERRLCWVSSYFSILTPVFLLWRTWQSVFRLFAGSEAAETFAATLQKKGDERGSSGIAALGEA